MNVVYKIVFTERKRRKNYPYYYIGSKSNCQFVNGKIFKNDKEYYGSSKYKNYSKIVKENIENITIEILHTFENYESCLKKENELHRKHNVVMSHEYFNQSYASINDFNDPNYALMKNVKSKKVCKILKNHPDVKCGLWVGITSGLKW